MSDKKNQDNKNVGATKVNPKNQEPFDKNKAVYNHRGDVWNPYTKEWEPPDHMIV